MMLLSYSNSPFQRYTKKISTTIHELAKNEKKRQREFGREKKGGLEGWEGWGLNETRDGAEGVAVVINTGLWNLLGDSVFVLFYFFYLIDFFCLFSFFFFPEIRSFGPIILSPPFVCLPFPSLPLSNSYPDHHHHQFNTQSTLTVDSGFEKNASERGMTHSFSLFLISLFFVCF